MMWKMKAEDHFLQVRREIKKPTLMKLISDLNLQNMGNKSMLFESVIPICGTYNKLIQVYNFLKSHIGNSDKHQDIKPK